MRILLTEVNLGILAVASKHTRKMNSTSFQTETTIAKNLIDWNLSKEAPKKRINFAKSKVFKEKTGWGAEKQRQSILEYGRKKVRK